MTSVSVHSSSARAEYRRERFTVDGVRVGFDGETWHCECPDCASGHSCTHIGQAQRFRHLRSARQHTQPIQLAFDAPDFRLAHEKSCVEQEPHSSAEDSALIAVTNTVRRHGRSGAVIAAAVIGGVFFGLLAYWSAKAPPVIATVAVASPRPASIEHHSTVTRLPPAPTVKLANPFDPSETFEFPPGTSDDEARDTVASLLLERARQRMASTAERDHAL